MEVEDYFSNGKRRWLRLHEKGGKRHEMPVHHKLEQFLDEYLDAGRHPRRQQNPLFRSALGRTRILTTGRCIASMRIRWFAGAPPRPG